MLLNHSLFAFLAAFAAVLIWSLSPLLIKFLAMTLPLSYFLVFRYGLSSLILSPVLIRQRPRNLPLRLWVELSLCLVLHLGLQVVAIRDLPVSWYIVLFALNPVLAMIWVTGALRPQMWPPVALAIVGTLLFVSDVSFDPLSLKAFACLAVSMLSWIHLTRSICKLQEQRLGHLSIAALTNLIAFVFFALYWAASGFPVESVSYSQLAILGGLSLLVPAGFFFFSVALKRSPSVAIMSQYPEPVLGSFAGILVLGETLTALQGVGAFFILISSMATIQKGEAQ